MPVRTGRLVHGLVAIIIVVHVRFHVDGQKDLDLSTMLVLYYYRTIGCHAFSFLVLDGPPMTTMYVAVARRPNRTFAIQHRPILDKA
jgi:hypothetical protein